jgi:hypothetical protein
MFSLKTIYGTGTSYSRCLELSGLDCLKDRRTKLVENSALKNKDGRFAAEWFPKNNPKPYELRQTEKFAQKKPNSERTKKSPLYIMRSYLNEYENRLSAAERELLRDS